MGTSYSGTGTITNDDNADPTGFYDAGSATIKNPADAANDIVLSDLYAIINNNRLMIMSLSSVILYDATITAVSGNDFTATVKVYHGMDVFWNVAPPAPIETTISGTITEGSQISGTIAGTGIGTGNFSLTYGLSNANVAAVANVMKLWEGDVNTVVQGTFDLQIINANGEIDVGFSDAPNMGIFDRCQMSGTLTSVANTTVFTQTITMIGCRVPENDGDYSGLATTTSSMHDNLVFMLSNGTVSIISVFTVK